MSLDVTTLTTTDFKNQFFRDFPYLPVWVGSLTYFQNDVVYYSLNGLFYQCQANGITSNPTIDTVNWIVYNDKIYNYILDQDITNAYTESQDIFNYQLFDTDSNIKLGYLYLSAHVLCLNIRNAMQGVQSHGENIVNSRNVGSVSESYSIPERYLNDPILVEFTKTSYGLRYLNMVLPKMVGNIVSVMGLTQP